MDPYLSYYYARDENARDENLTLVNFYLFFIALLRVLY